MPPLVLKQTISKRGDIYPDTGGYALYPGLGFIDCRFNAHQIPQCPGISRCIPPNPGEEFVESPQANDSPCSSIAALAFIHAIVKLRTGNGFESDGCHSSKRPWMRITRFASPGAFLRILALLVFCRHDHTPVSALANRGALVINRSRSRWNSLRAGHPH